MTAAVLGATLACAPADEIPIPDREKQARLEEVAEMLYARGAGAAPGLQRLERLLDSLTRFPPAEAATRALTVTVDDALGGRRISRDASERVAWQLYTLMNGGYLTRPRLEQVTQGLERELASAGASPAAVTLVVQAGVRAAREPKNPRTDWW